ncbi:hypothetical protein FO440_23280 [Mucilaginibacter corticis]|uniref:DUF5655 domain-containing protein n=1 Tax=Mucilaginibacter corticis TaxID=2597670 RepID=A0A556M923_9SPHI|nr:DUF5655 domain-containing protein [Mucilaginibacter corticis]TSJ36427.1 hypothetical protein FO440_23280 [Mucilaginibacter corticis]
MQRVYNKFSNSRSEELVLVFDKILAEVADWNKVVISTTPNCIMFYRRTAFLIIRPMKKWLDLKIYSKTGHKDIRCRCYRNIDRFV